jgi:hypothetical protein
MISSFFFFSMICFLCAVISNLGVSITERSILNISSSFLVLNYFVFADGLSLKKKWYKDKRLNPLVFRFSQLILFRTLFSSLFILLFVLGIGSIFDSILNTSIVVYGITLINVIRLFKRYNFEKSFLSIKDWMAIIFFPIVYSACLTKYYQYEIGGFYLKTHQKMETENT